jgi:hypothetical protein
MDAVFMSLELHGWGSHVVKTGAPGPRKSRRLVFTPAYNRYFRPEPALVSPAG